MYGREVTSKMVSQKGLPYLVGNKELKPLVSLPPNKANPFEVTFVVSHKRDYCIESPCL